MMIGSSPARSMLAMATQKMTIVKSVCTVARNQGRPRRYRLSIYALSFLRHDLGEVGDGGEVAQDGGEQGEAVGAEIRIVDHDHDFVEERVKGWTDLRDLGERG